jgi:DNA-binding CsgD family transcriptional regulator
MAIDNNIDQTFFMRAYQKLSAREKSVIELYAAGYSTEDICLRLGINKKTVQTYKYRASEKLYIKSFSNLMYVMGRVGI